MLEAAPSTQAYLMLSATLFAVGLAIIIQLYRLRSTINVDEARELNG